MKIKLIGLFSLLALIPLTAISEGDAYTHDQIHNQDPWLELESAQETTPKSADECKVNLLKIDTKIVGCKFGQDCIKLPENKHLTVGELAKKYCNLESENIAAFGTAYAPEALSKKGGVEVGFENINLEGIPLNIKLKLKSTEPKMTD